MDVGNFSLSLDPADYARPEPSSEGNRSAGALVGAASAAAADAAGAAAASAVSSARISAEAVERTIQKKATPCVPMLMRLDLPEPLGAKTLVLGEPVLRKYFTAFDAGAQRVGFADAVHGESSQRIFL